MLYVAGDGIISLRSDLAHTNITHGYLRTDNCTSWK